MVTLHPSSLAIGFMLPFALAFVGLMALMATLDVFDKWNARIDKWHARKQRQTAINRLLAETAIAELERMD